MFRLALLVASAPCLLHVQARTVPEVAPPPVPGCAQAGQDGTLVLCLNGPPHALHTVGGDPGGTWLDGFAQPHAAVFTPGVDLPGCYRYIVTGTSPCANDTAFLCISTDTPPDAGTDRSFSFCGSGPPFTLSTGGAPGGTWIGPDGLPTDPVFDPAVDANGCYTYRLPAQDACPEQLAHVCITVSQSPNAGLDTAVTLCANNDPVDLSTFLVNADAGGIWTGPDNIPVSGIFDPEAGIPGCYTYTVVAPAPCPNSSAVVCVSVLPCSVGLEEQGITLHTGGGDALHPIVSLVLPAQPLTWDLLDAAGRMVQHGTLHGTGQQQLMVDLTPCAAGIYTLRAMSGAKSGYLRLVR